MTFLLLQKFRDEYGYQEQCHGHHRNRNITDSHCVCSSQNTVAPGVGVFLFSQSILATHARLTFNFALAEISNSEILPATSVISLRDVITEFEIG
jgi:hypothetical protein